MNIKINHNESTNEITNQIKKEVLKQSIIWSDDLNAHYIFDFKCLGYWIESTKINNELTEIEINIFK
jgi:hypothetical protein